MDLSKQDITSPSPTSPDFSGAPGGARRYSELSKSRRRRWNTMPAEIRDTPFFREVFGEVRKKFPSPTSPDFRGAPGGAPRSSELSKSRRRR